MESKCQRVSNNYSKRSSNKEETEKKINLVGLIDEFRRMIRHYEPIGIATILHCLRRSIHRSYRLSSKRKGPYWLQKVFKCNNQVLRSA